MPTHTQLADTEVECYNCGEDFNPENHTKRFGCPMCPECGEVAPSN